jgi:hypothetical protein
MLIKKCFLSAMNESPSHLSHLDNNFFLFFSLPQLLQPIVDMNVTDGEKVEVERNAASRFVDFSCSTEWEKSVLKIENLIRAFVLKGKDNDSEIFRLMGMKLRISFHSNDIDTPDYLPSLFEIQNKYILISRAGNDWLDCTTSQRHTMFSVLVTALQSSLSGANCEKQTPPIFLTMVREEDIKFSRTLDIIGYQIYRRLNSSTVVNFDSHSQNYNLLEDGKERFRYIDSLSKLFEKHVSLHQNKMQLSNFASDVVVQVTEESSIKLSSPPENVPIHLQLSKARINTYVLVQALLWRINEIYIPLDVRKRSNRTNVVDIRAMLAYHSTKLAAIVDNENYSTLVASKQPFYCWSVCVRFSPRGVHSVSQTVTLSASIRRLLVLFLYRKCEESVCTVGSNSSSSSGSGSGGENGTVKSEKVMINEQAKAMAAVLSKKTIGILNAMCLHDEDQETIQNEDILIDGLLDLMFLENVLQGNGTSSPPPSPSPSSSTSFADDLILESTKNNIEFLSLQAFCMASLQTFVSSANLWSRFLLILRSRWEHGAPMPGVRGKKVDHSIEDEKLSLHKRLLWNDIISRRDDMSGYNPDYVVDRSTPILTQKLKALQFCILVKNEKVYSEPYGDGITLQRRLPLTSDAYAQRMFVLEKLRPEIKNENHEEKVKENESEKGDGGQIKDGEGSESLNTEMMIVDKENKIENESNSETKSNNVDNIEEKEKGTTKNNTNLDNTPINDENKNTSKLSEKFNEVVSLSQLQYWKVEKEILISDMSAWKSFHGFEEEGCFHGFEDFLVWYFRDEKVYKSRIEENKKDLTVMKKVNTPEVQLRSRSTVHQKNKNKDNVVDVDILMKNILDDESNTENVFFRNDVTPTSSSSSSQNKETKESRDKNKNKNKEGGISTSTVSVPVTDTLTHTERAVWATLWHSCTPARSVSEQKALFNAEREAEKILGFLGGMSPVHVMSDLILSATAASLPVLCAMVDCNVRTVSALVHRLSPTTDVSSVRNVLGQEHSLKNLLSLIQQASCEVRVDVTHCIDRNKECSVSQSDFLSVDNIANLIEKIEEYCTNVRALSRTLDHAFQNLNSAFQNGDSEGDLMCVFASVLPLLIHSVCSSEEGSFIPKNVREVGELGTITCLEL